MGASFEHFKMPKNVHLARQAFITVKPLVSGAINKFTTPLQTLAEHCDPEGERDNQVNETIKNLKSKFYRELRNIDAWQGYEIFGHYHDKQALILLSES